MDDVERLIAAFRARPTPSALRKLDLLLDLERLRDPRLAPFVVELLLSQGEPSEVRLRVIKQIRAARGLRSCRAALAQALARVLAEHASPDLRLPAALTLAEFTDVTGIPAALGAVALDATEPLDLRYSAFTGLERAGPEPECVAVLRQLEADEALGQSAHSLLARWQLA